MTQFLKPSNLNNVWASGGDRIYPGDTKYATGWQVEIPPRQYFNEIDYKQDQMLAHLNQHGIPVWDNETEYQADQSYVQGSTGTVYRCVLTHTNQNPDLDVSNTYWIIAFASAGDFYTATESDARYAQLANNGSDYNPSTFRTNISVYSKAETYTKTEVDSRTTVASTAQAVSQTSNSTLLSPLRLAEAFLGNQSIADNGYVKLPGGLIIQWGKAPDDGGTRAFPLPFPTKCFVLVGSLESDVFSSTSAINVFVVSNTQFRVREGSASTAGNFIYWVAIGH